MRSLTFHLPDLGEGLPEAEVVEWHVSVGDEVHSGQPLVSVETDKAVVDIPSPRTARIVALHGSPGDIVAVGAALVEFERGESDKGAVVGRLAETPAEVSAPEPTPSALDRTRIRATPKARRRARELGVALEHVSPTGDIVQLEDVELAAAESTVSTAGHHARDGAGVGLKGVRRAMATRMADAHVRVVPACVTEEADVSAWNTAQKPLPRLVRALIRGIQQEPLLNARFDDRALTLVPQDDIHLGIAMETKDGLFVPVLRNAAQFCGNESGDDELMSALEVLQTGVTNRSLPPEDLRGQTITLSNFGAVAGLHAQMVVVPPQVAILGAGRLFSRLTMHQGLPGTGRILPLSLTFDHRAITGVEACRFLAAAIEDLQSPH